MAATFGPDSVGPQTRVVANIGCGPVGADSLPPFFAGWRRLRVDVDASVAPDIIATATDLSKIPAASVGAIWTAHCIEHLYAHEVPRALAEFHRILTDDGFLCVIVPDLQAIAKYVAADKMHEVIYESPAGPVTAHDIIFGFGMAIAQGRVFMAHRCGFTPTMMLQRFGESPFAELILRRRPALELAAVARKQQFAEPAERDALLAALGI